MKASELIDKLREADPDALVVTKCETSPRFRGIADVDTAEPESVVLLLPDEFLAARDG